MAALKILIGVMTVLIVVGLVVVVWRIATLSGDGPPPAEVVLALAPGCEIAAATAGDRTAAITVIGPQGCNAVYIVDLASGAVLTTVRP